MWQTVSHGMERMSHRLAPLPCEWLALSGMNDELRSRKKAMHFLWLSIDVAAVQFHKPKRGS